MPTDTQREPGYYWVKFNGDAATVGDMDVIMGLCYPGQNIWVVGFCNENGIFEIAGYDISDYYLSEINETRILPPNEQ